MGNNSRRRNNQVDQRTLGYNKLEELRRQYDPERGGYTVRRRGGKIPYGREVFIPSEFTPEEGGYYSNPVEKTPGRAGQPKTGPGYADSNVAKAVKAYATEESNNKSRAKPFTRPSGGAGRNRQRKSRRLAATQSTILGGSKSLGNGTEDDLNLRRKTLLGG